MKRILYNDDILSIFESTKDFNQKIEYLKRKVDELADQKDVLLRLLTECWWVLSFWECGLDTVNLDRSMFEDNLKKTYYRIMELFGDDVDCVWMIGYQMFINPEAFVFLDMDLYSIQDFGEMLTINAHKKDPLNPLAEIMFLGSYGKRIEYIKKKELIKNVILDYFPNESKVNAYFTDIFTNIY